METKLEGWTVIDHEAGVLWREYEFRKGAYANTFVFRGTDGLVVVSPAIGLESRHYDALGAFGDVKALIANNSYHTLGQSAWRAHFPAAVSYCPPRAVQALTKKMHGIPFHSLHTLPLPPHVYWEDAPGFRTGETLLSVRTGKGSVWYSGDLLANLQRLPRSLFRWLFSWTDSAPGFRLFKPSVWLFVTDRKALRTWALRRLENDPPVVVVPAHGPPVETDDVAARARAQIERL